AMARLVHPNVVGVHAVGELNELPYLVMDYIPGKDLSQLLRATIRVGAPWDVETAIHVVREVGQGLLYAHSYEQPDGTPLQIVHRDVASKNVMIDGTGSVRLMDFGVATSLSTMTSRIHVKGTLPYMAPEHYLGQAATASDVFGLGAIFWEMLAGRKFRAELEGQELIAK
ncbi:MAG: serine/threonine protein kinase, partial [Myxococcales bacterium]|nr:serine/threonine protein kinase [Myxococcales bacterium]